MNLNCCALLAIREHKMSLCEYQNFKKLPIANKFKSAEAINLDMFIAYEYRQSQKRANRCYNSN